jgi:hypothetical protein
VPAASRGFINRLPGRAHDFKHRPWWGRPFGETAMIYGMMRKSGSVILYGSSIALGLVLCKAWFIVHAFV